MHIIRKKEVGYKPGKKVKAVDAVMLFDAIMLQFLVVQTTK